MVNYENAKVYKICGPESEAKCYVGSTVQQSESRWGGHISAYRSWKAGTGKTYYSSFILFDLYGIDKCKIIVLEKCSVTNRTELLKREQHYMKTVECVNQINAHTTIDQRKEAKKAYREAQKPKEIRTLDPVTGVVRVQIFANKKRNLPKKEN